MASRRALRGRGLWDHVVGLQGVCMTVTVWSLIFGWIVMEARDIAEARTVIYQWERDQQACVRMAGGYRFAVIRAGQWERVIPLRDGLRV